MITLRKHSVDAETPQLKIVVPTPLYGGSLPIADHAADAFGDLGHYCETLKFDEAYRLFEMLGSGVEDLAGKKLKSRFAELLAAHNFAEETGLYVKLDEKLSDQDRTEIRQRMKDAALM